nr:putative reverse transcriptase domain-containing protein [Tanacetum cinerariifolium]
YVGPFKVLAKVGAISYKLELPQELSRVHSTFHVSNLKKCYSDEQLAIPLDGLHIDDKLCFVEEPIEMIDQEHPKVVFRCDVVNLGVLHWNSSRPELDKSIDGGGNKPVGGEDTSSKAMVAIDGAGFDWSYMADDEVPTNMAVIDFSDSKVQNSKTCSNTCLKSFETLKAQYDNLRIKFNKSEFDLATYIRGLASVEEQLIFYKKNEVVFCDQIAVLKRDASFRDSEITALYLQIEKLKKEKESNQIKIDNFKNASKSLDNLIGSQITDNNREGLGFTSYNAVAPPPTGLFPPPSIDLSNSGLEEFQCNTPKFTTSQWNTTLGCYFIVHMHKSQKTTSKEMFYKKSHSM